MKKLNPYKLVWPILGIIVLGLVVWGVFYIASQQQPDKEDAKQQLPDYEESKMPGEVVKTNPIPDLPEREPTEEDFNIPQKDDSLKEADAPLAGSAIKVPDEQALPPEKADVLELTLSKDGFSPSSLEGKQTEPVIIRLSNQLTDCVFYIERIGIAEKVEQDQVITISFRAPAEKVSLAFYCQKITTEEKLAEGILNIK